MQSISIVFDEGNDGAPELFGLAELDNIDINGVLIGGPGEIGKTETGTATDRT